MKTWFYLVLSSLSFAVSATEYIQRGDPVSTYNRIRSLSWSPDGSQFVVCCQGHRTAYAMTSTGKNRRDIPSTKELGKEQRNATCVAWCPSPYIAVGTDKGKTDVWSTAIKKRKSLLTYPKKARTKWRGEPIVLSLAWNPKKRSQLAVGYDTRVLCVWNILARQEEPCSIFEHDSEVKTVAWGSDGRLASGAGDIIRIWSFDLDTPLQTLPMQGVQSICWGPGKMLVAGGVMPRRLRSVPAVKVWDVDAQVSTKKELDDFVNAVDWSSDGSLIAVGANRGKVYLLDAPSRSWRQGIECQESTPPSVETKANSKPSDSLTANVSVSFAKPEESGGIAPQISLSLNLSQVITFIASMLRSNPPAVRDVKWSSKSELAAGNEESEGRVFVYVPKKTFSRSCWETFMACLCCCRKSKTD